MTDSIETYVAIATEINNPAADTVLYAGVSEESAVNALKQADPTNFDFGRVQRWKDGELHFTKEYNLHIRMEVVEV